MKIKLLCCLMVFLLAVPLAAKAPKGDYDQPVSAIIDNSTFISANRILMFVTNHGNFGRDLSGIFGHDYGTWYPYPVGQDTSLINSTVLQNLSPNYASGLWVGATDSATNTTRIVISEYSSEYGPGPMVGGTYATPDQPYYRVFKLYKDSLKNNPNQDYLDYMAYGPAQGAPFWEEDTYSYDEITGDSTLIGEAGEPRINGDQFLWAVYNDANAGLHTNDAGETLPLGIEVKQSIFGFNRDNPLGDVVFMRYQVFNRGNNVLKNCYFSLWADPDLGGAGDDLVGCDTLLGLGYVYNATNDDSQYGTRPPCMAFDFLQGPLMEGDETDTAIMWNFTRYPGMKNMGMTSFNKYINGTDPDNFNETYGFMQGLSKDGSPYEYNGQVLVYVHSGDPVSGVGDLDIAPADRRWMQTTGPIDFRPGDSTEIVAAMIVAQATDRKTSISLMRFYDRFAQLTYDNEFVTLEPPARPVLSAGKESGQIVLSWTDTSEVDHGTYPFEGYTIYQGETNAGPWYRVTTYDINNALDYLFDEVFDPVTGVPEIRLIQSGTNSGVYHFITITEDFIIGGPLRDVSTYHYKVEAYAAFPEGPLGLRMLSSNSTISVIPQAPPAGVEFGAQIGETLPVTHVGPSDGVVSPFVVNSSALTGHEYRVTFTAVPDTAIEPWEYADTTFAYDTTVTTDTCDVAWVDGDLVVTYCIQVDTIITDIDADSGIDTIVTMITYWHVWDETAGTWVLQDQTNQTGDENYEIFDGVWLKVEGPAPGVKTSDMFETDDVSLWGWDIPSGTRRFTWVNGDAWEFEGFRGALGWESPPHFFYGFDKVVGADELVNVELRLATVDTLGNFDPNDENVSYAYRYLRGATAPPAQPEFAPYIVNVAGGYAFQEYDKTCPLSAWNIDVDPPQRLAIGYLENNGVYATLDGKYWPPNYLEMEVDNLAADGAREWLFIYLDEYTDDTPVLDYTGDVIFDPIPVMYWATWTRRGVVPFSPTVTGIDQFQIFPGKINVPADTFYFTATAMSTVASQGALDDIKVVPNPYYLIGGYDPTPGASAIKFHHLPQQCTISIYNLSGELVKTIHKDDVDAIATWDVTTHNGLPVASGIYIWVVDAPGFGQKVGKMAVFVQQEVLQIY